eukprot:COSAG05_NODE_4196_length_1628_cov_1.367560_3_plen_117_part_00
MQTDRIKILTDGDMFGVRALDFEVEDVKRVVTAKALTGAELMLLAADKIEELGKKYPTLADTIKNYTSQRFEKPMILHQERVAQAEQRVARLTEDLARAKEEQARLASEPTRAVAP